MGKTSKGRIEKPPPSLSDTGEGHRLMTLIENEIIPRLMDAHRSGYDSPPDGTTLLVSEIQRFALALLEPSREPAEILLEHYRDRGVPLDTIYLGLFASAARHLGDMWLDDSCSFSQVTLGLWRIHSLMHDLGPSFHALSGNARSQHVAERRILLTSLPGQQHTFGLSLLSEFFRRDGWIALCVPSPAPGSTQSTLSAHWFDVFALTASMDSEVGDLEKTIKAARKTSQNPRLVVLVGGPLLLRRPELCNMIGADGTAADAPAAIALAATLVQAQQEVRLN